MEESGEVVHVWNARADTVALKPHVKLPESAELYIPTSRKGEGPRDDAPLVQL